MALWRLAELMPDKYSHVYQLQQAAKYFSLAYQAGLPSKARSWNESLLTTTREYIDDTVLYSQTLAFHDRTRFLNEIASCISEEHLKATCFLQLAYTIFKRGILKLEEGDSKECIMLVYECYTPVE